MLDARFLYVRNPRKKWLAGMQRNGEPWSDVRGFVTILILARVVACT